MAAQRKQAARIGSGVRETNLKDNGSKREMCV